MTIPKAASLSSMDPSCSAMDPEYGSSPLEILAQKISRGLYATRHEPFRRYFEYLHDFYNAEQMDQESVALGTSASFRGSLDRLLSGNAVSIQGVPNAPYFSRNAFSKPQYRVHWSKLRSLMRTMEQRLPHFASRSVEWGLSMALSRALVVNGDGGPTAQAERVRYPFDRTLPQSLRHVELVIFPLIDFVNHSSDPNSLIMLTTPGVSTEASRVWQRKAPAVGSASVTLLRCAYGELRNVQEQQLVHFLPSSGDSVRIGLDGWDPTEPHAHLIATKDIAAGAEVLCQYSDTPDPEWWRFHFGFVPEAAKTKGA
jgi:hypothetical protein